MAESLSGAFTLICWAGCSSGRRPDPWSARRAARSSASTTRAATTAAAAIPGLWGFAPDAPRLRQRSRVRHVRDCGCSVLYVASLLLTVSPGKTSWAAAIRCRCYRRPRTSSSRSALGGAVPVFGYGQWWTMLSAVWLHGSVLHILFNMLWVRQLGPATADIYGPGRMVIIYSLSGAARASLLSSVRRRVPRRSCRRRSAGQPHDRRRLRLDLRSARRARLLRPPRRQLDDPVARRSATPRRSSSWGSSCRGSTTTPTPADYLGGYLVVDVAGSAQARADGPPRLSRSSASPRRGSPCVGVVPVAGASLPFLSRGR